MPWQKQGSVSSRGHAEMRTPRWKLILQEAWNTIRILSAATTIMRITETVPDMETIAADTAAIERLNREKRKRRKKLFRIREGQRRRRIYFLRRFCSLLFCLNREVMVSFWTFRCSPGSLPCRAYQSLG